MRSFRSTLKKIGFLPNLKKGLASFEIKIESSPGLKGRTFLGFVQKLQNLLGLTEHQKGIVQNMRVFS